MNLDKVREAIKKRHLTMTDEEIRKESPNVKEMEAELVRKTTVNC